MAQDVGNDETAPGCALYVRDAIRANAAARQ
jgi:hypothetical protein